MSTTTPVPYEFFEPITGRVMVVHFGDAPGVEHHGCAYRAEVLPHLDAVFCRHCGLNGRITGAWFMDLLAKHTTTEDAMSTIEYLYGRDGDEYLDTDPEDTLERIWDLSGPDPLPIGHEVEVHQWEARGAEEFMPSVDALLDRYRDLVHEEVGEDCVDSIKWDAGPLRGAASHFVAEMNRHIHWKQAGRKVGTARYRLVDSDACEWEEVL